MKRAKCPCCGAEVRSNEKTEAWARRWRCEPCGAPGTVSYDSQRRQARGAPGAAALEGGGKLHVPPIDLVLPDVLRPAGWWAEHCSQPCPFRADFWLGCSHAENPTPAGEPLLSMPADDDIDPLYRTCSASPKRGGDGPVWGS